MGVSRPGRLRRLFRRWRETGRETEFAETFLEKQFDRKTMQRTPVLGVRTGVQRDCWATGETSRLTFAARFRVPAVFLRFSVRSGADTFWFRRKRPGQSWRKLRRRQDQWHTGANVEAHADRGVSLSFDHRPVVRAEVVVAVIHRLVRIVGVHVARAVEAAAAAFVADGIVAAACAAPGVVTRLEAAQIAGCVGEAVLASAAASRRLTDQFRGSRHVRWRRRRNFLCQSGRGRQAQRQQHHHRRESHPYFPHPVVFAGTASGWQV